MWEWLAAAVVILLLNDAVLLFVQKRKRKQELEYVVEMIDHFLDTPRNGGKDNDIENKGDKEGMFFSEFKDTELSKIAHRLVKLQERLEGQKEEISRDRDEVRKLIAEIAHQLRTPLANMETYTELLRGAETEEEKWLYTDAIAESEEKIHFLVESFIKMARLETNVIQIRKESRDLKGTIDAAVCRAERQAAEKGISIQRKGIWEEEEGRKLEAWHDSNWLGEAVYNLLDNAVKYSPKGSSVEIYAEKSELSVRIQVRDHGIGIVSGEESEIFKRFYRGKNVTVQEGYGLGLYLTREIVTRHDGYVRVKRMERGSIFEICLPV